MAGAEDVSLDSQKKRKPIGISRASPHGDPVAVPVGVFLQRHYLEWQVGFTRKCKGSRASREAWQKIKEVKGEDEALRLLFEYEAADDRIRLLLPKLKRLTYLAQSYRRAAQRILKSDSTPSKIRLRRCRESLEALLSAPWPFTEARAPYLSPKQIAGVKTLRDAVQVWPEQFPHDEVSLRPIFQEYAHVFARAADDIRRFGGKPVLRMLKDRMAALRLHLGAGEIAALAHCARRGAGRRRLERKNLAHFLDSRIMQDVAPAYAELLTTIISQ